MKKNKIENNNGGTIYVNDLVVFFIIFILGQAYSFNSSIILLGGVLGAICAGGSFLLISLAAILGCIFGWYMKSDVTISLMYPIVVALVINLFMYKVGKYRVDEKKQIFVNRLSLIISYVAAQSVLSGMKPEIFIYALGIFMLSVVLEGGFRKIKSGTLFSSGKEELISLMVLSIVTIFCIPQIGNTYISVKLTFTLFAVLWLAYSYGAGCGAVSGACLLAAVSSSFEYFFMYVAVVVFAAIASALVSEAGKTISAATFCMTIGVFHLIFSIEEIKLINPDRHFIGAAISAGLLLIFLPVEKIRSIPRTHEQEINEYENIDIRKTTKNMLTNMAHELSSLSMKLQGKCYREDVNDEAVENQLIEGVVVTVCNTCVRREDCWNYNYGETVMGMGQVAQMVLYGDENEMMAQDYELVDTIPFISGCLNGANLIQKIKEGANSIRQNIRMNNSLLQMREAMGIQMKEIADIIGEYAVSMFEPVNIGYNKKMKLIKQLNKNGIVTSGISILSKSDGRYSIKIQAHSIGETQISIKRISETLSFVLGKKIVSAKNEIKIVDSQTRVYYFVEKTNFKIMTGVVSVAKDGADINGDNYSLMQTQDKNVVMMIADGMGTGREAFDASNETIEVLEKFIDVGFKTETSVQLLNTVLFNNSDGLESTSIDLCKINRYTGICNFTKVGASSSFIKRNKSVEIINMINCPVGVSEDTWCDTVVKKLYDGNHVIMVSDGVIDSLGENGEEEIKKFLLGCDTINAQQMADEIFNLCLSVNNGIITDDMTILVAGIWS